MKNIVQTKTLSLLLTLAMVVGLMPGMSMTAYASTEKSEAITTTVETTSTGAIVNGTYFTISNNGIMADEDGMAAYKGITVSPKNNEYITKVVITCEYNSKYVKDDNTTVSSGTKTITNGGGTITVTEVNANTFTFTCKNSGPHFNQFVVYYLDSATPASSYSVTITAGDHMTKTTDSGAASQTGLSGAMTPVVYTANEGYYFPENYSVEAVNEISVTCNSYTQITVSGTPTADATITLTAPTAKTTPAAPTTATAVDCTTTDNNDGKLTGVTTAMEYMKSDAADWTAGTGSDITGLVPGTYYVRLKATDTTTASDNQELTVKKFISYTVTFKVVNGKWNEGEGDAATADKTVTLTGYEGDTLKLASNQIPAVGNKPNDTYKAGSWDVTPSADTAITGATTYTYTYAQKSAITPTVNIDGWTYGETANAPSVDGNTGNGAVTYTYAAKGSDSFSATVPTNAGNYTVKATIAATANYSGGTATADFTIAKANITPTVSIDGWTYNLTAKTPSVSGNSGNGTVTYTYATKGSDSFSATVPTNAGNYTVKATIAATANYNGATATADFTIAKANITPTVSIDGWTYNQTAKTPSVSGNSGNGTVTYTYATKGSDSFSATVPTNAGNYTVKATIAATTNYNGATATADFTITKADPTYTVPTGLTATYGQTLANVTLPTGWAWVDSTQSVGNIGTNTFKANFTPADTANYNTVSGVDVNVTVGKTAGKDATISTDTMTYNSDSIYIEGVAGQEYVIVPKGTAVTDADWNTTVKPDPERDNWVFFENLKEATEYEIYTRTAETETAFASDAVKANVYTTLSSIGYDYDSTLVGASITVEPESNVEGLTYKWYQDEVTEDGEGAIHHNLTEIPGATGSTYTFRTEDAGKHIAVKIFAGDSEVGDFATDAPVVSTAKVIFDSKGGSDVETLTDAAYQSKIKAPADPTREGFAFDGWYWDEEFETPFDFEKDVITWTETTLYAKWTPNDYKITSVTGLTGANNKQWTKGGKDAVVFTVKLSGEDNSFDHFTGVKLDGQLLTKDVDYTVTKGSTIVTLLPATLEKLSVGEHTVTVLFDNGEVGTDLTVKAANSGNPTSAQTGDNSHMGLWIAMILLALCGLAATLFIGKKKRVFDR